MVLNRIPAWDDTYSVSIFDIRPLLHFARGAMDAIWKPEHIGKNWESVVRRNDYFERPQLLPIWAVDRWQRLTPRAVGQLAGDCSQRNSEDREKLSVYITQYMKYFSADNFLEALFNRLNYVGLDRDLTVVLGELGWLGEGETVQQFIYSEEDFSFQHDKARELFAFLGLVTKREA